jgi:hypothetical protein
MAIPDFLSVDFLRETSFPKQDPEERRQIDAVLFSIWARGQRQRSGLSTSFLILLSRLISLLAFIVEIPRIVMREVPRLAFSWVIGFLLAFALDVSGIWRRAALVISIYLIFRAKPLVGFIRNLIFDLCDFVFLGRLTKAYIHSWEAFGPIKILSEPEFAFHLFTSRVLTAGDADDEISAAQDFFSDPAGTTSERREAITRYWEGYPLNTQYWRTIKKTRPS